MQQPKSCMQPLFCYSKIGCSKFKIGSSPEVSRSICQYMSVVCQISTIKDMNSDRVLKEEMKQEVHLVPFTFELSRA